MFKYRRSVLAAALLVLSGAAVAQAGPIVYNQPALFPPNGGAAWTSETTVADGPVWQTFDNFTLASNQQIRAVTWQGIYFNDFAAAPFAAATAFDIRFYSSVAGAPGAQLYGTTLGIAAVHETFVGNLTFFGNQSPIYNYQATLPVDFIAAAGTQYWFSVIAREPTFRPNIWAWTAGSGGDGASYQQYFFDANVSGFRDGDRAFSLEAVPEPATMLLFGSGLAGLLVARARRNRTT